MLFTVYWQCSAEVVVLPWWCFRCSPLAYDVPRKHDTLFCRAPLFSIYDLFLWYWLYSIQVGHDFWACCFRLAIWHLCGVILAVSLHVAFLLSLAQALSADEITKRRNSVMSYSCSIEYMGRRKILTVVFYWLWRHVVWLPMLVCLAWCRRKYGIFLDFLW